MQQRMYFALTMLVAFLGASRAFVPLQTSRLLPRSEALATNALKGSSFSSSRRGVVSMQAVTRAATSPTLPLISNAAVSGLRFLEAIWDFSRPHTIVGSGISVLTIFLFACPPQTWVTGTFWRELGLALAPSLLMNIYITGANQCTDVEIDKINKPYLPLASGSLKERDGLVIVLMSLVGSLLFARTASWPLQLVLLGSGLLGTIYSLPPFRLKRFPLAAAFCILVVRGSLVNLGFFLHAKQAVLGADIGGSVWKACHKFPESLALASFFAVFGIVIALMKDVPDIKGDKMFKIPSFSVKLGARTMFNLASKLLVVLLGGSAAASLGWSFSAYKMGGGALAAARVGIAALLSSLAIDVQQRARVVNPEVASEVFSNYMHLWNVFYICYAILPLVGLARGL